MDRTEARKWLRDHGIQPITAERMLMFAVQNGSSGNVASEYGRGPEIFVTFDGQMFNPYFA